MVTGKKKNIKNTKMADKKRVAWTGFIHGAAHANLKTLTKDAF